CQSVEARSDDDEVGVHAHSPRSGQSSRQGRPWPGGLTRRRVVTPDSAVLPTGADPQQLRVAYLCDDLGDTCRHETVQTGVVAIAQVATDSPERRTHLNPVAELQPLHGITNLGTLVSVAQRAGDQGAV